MARRRKNPAGGIGLFIVGGVVALISSIPKEGWIAIGALAAIGLVIWIATNSKASDSESVNSGTVSPHYRVTAITQTNHQDASLEPLRGDPVATRWIPAGQPVHLADTRIDGGMFYFGSELRAESGDIDPALIEPRARVSRSAPHYSQRQTDYWPSYSTISPDARRTYISWLSSSRDDPVADIGYVFLYFYGLERRVLVDARTDAAARNEVPQIESEIVRLVKIYGSNRSFSRYANSLLDYLACQRTLAGPGGPPPITSPRTELPLAMKIGLGRFAASGKPLPVDWALAWVQCDYRIGNPRPMERCPNEFEKLFAERYSAAYGEGMRLPMNRTKLQYSYKPASAGFAGSLYSCVPDNLPDVTAVIAPIKKLESLVEVCAESLAPYSRFIGKDPAGAGTLDGTLLLPQSLWPASARKAMDALDERIGDGLRVMTLGELSTALGGEGALTRNKARALAHALEELRIGIEPDILAGARTPKANDKIILFRSDPEDASLRESSPYQAASVSLDLACSVAMADGKPHPNELQLLMKQIDGWTQLSAAQRKRLRARLRMAVDSPPKLSSLRTKLEAIPANGQRAIAHLMATLAQADGSVTPDEVKLLERIYKVLGLESQALYSDLHLQSTGAPATSSASLSKTPDTASQSDREVTPSGAINLDVARIEALQRETAEVSALLSSVFTDESAVSEERREERDEASSNIEPGPLGLDPEHSVFLRLIMTRDSWSRQELADAAADMEIMLDGAIERINDAAFEHFDAPLLEGDDPIEVSRDVMEKVTA